MSRLQYLRTIGAGELSATRLSEAVSRRVADVPHRLTWSISPQARENRRRIRGYRGLHAGQRCVLIANGPSLTRTPMELLENEITIGLNRVHLLEEKFGLRPNYVVVSDIVSQLQHIADDLAEIPVPKFVNWNGRCHVSGGDFHFFKTTFRPRFSMDFAAGVYGGHSVTYAALQLAHYMGFSEVVLVGKDHSYAIFGTPTSVVKSDGSEQNHFADGYYERGQIWRIPDYKGEEMAYRMARAAFESDGRSVIDATVDGHLDVFPKASLGAALA